MYLYGASGHCKVIVEILRSVDSDAIEGIFDDDSSKQSLMDLPVTRFRPDYSGNLIIAIGNNAIRKKIASNVRANFLIACHKHSVISTSSNVGDGTVVMAGAVINSEASVGKHCIINTSAVIEHDTTIADFVHISPNAALAGGVHIGEGTHIGIGASVIQGVKIGKWAIIGAGSVIIKDVPDYAIVVGNPARIIRFQNL